MRDIRPLRCEDDLTWALNEIAPYFQDSPAPGGPESDRFDVLAALIEAYENKHHPVTPADPVDMLHYAITDLGRSQAELAELFGSRSRASEVLNRKRALTLPMIWRLHQQMGLPAESLIRQPASN